jgi:hypothetical protein
MHPRKWEDVGFAAFIASVCMTASLNHNDGALKTDARRTAWFELYTQVRALPGADYPSPYTLQALTLAATFGVGANREPAAFRLLAETAFIVVGVGMHQSADWFDSRTRSAITRSGPSTSGTSTSPRNTRTRRSCACATRPPRSSRPSTMPTPRPRPSVRIRRARRAACRRSWHCASSPPREAILAPPSHRTGDAPGNGLARAAALLAPFANSSALQAEGALAETAERPGRMSEGTPFCPLFMY